MKQSILIVDDEKHTREGLRAALQEHFDVSMAGDAAGALAILEADPPDLVLTDLKLGVDDGMALMETILGRPEPPVCIMMTCLLYTSDAADE